MKKTFVVGAVLFALSAMQASAAFVIGTLNFTSTGTTQQAQTSSGGVDFSPNSPSNGEVNIPVNGSFTGFTGGIITIADFTSAGNINPFITGGPITANNIVIALDSVGATTIVGPAAVVQISGRAWFSSTPLEVNTWTGAITLPQGAGGQLSSWSGSLTMAPEPGTYALIGSALLGLGLLRRRKA
ncbi:MAG: PEP-CTERM sorting domain-containing protein [Bryobacteraceae bacterium]|nr:PEP-CTERM sorting domain-containing protein [Bryobacteraceae bacterium]